jgi:hypothetical protein
VACATRTQPRTTSCLYSTAVSYAKSFRKLRNYEAKSGRAGQTGINALKTAKIKARFFLVLPNSEKKYFSGSQASPIFFFFLSSMEMKMSIDVKVVIWCVSKHNSMCYGITVY